MDVSWIAVSVPGPPHGETNAYLIGTEEALLVDPAARSDALDEAVADCSVTHIAVTHHHPDHVGAVREYRAETGATVWARQGREASFKRATGVVPDRTFHDGTVIETGSGAVRVLAVPGHAPEHVAFADESETEQQLVVGDLARASGSIAIGAPEGDMRAYLTSLRRVLVRDFDRLHPGHGPAIEDPHATIRDLISHRREREQRVLESIERGASTISAITDTAYEKDVSAVRALAEATVTAHLEKLAVEGRIEWDGARVSIPE